MDRKDDTRKAIEAADETGLVADEERIDTAEASLLALRSSFPRERLHAALPATHGARASVDRLQAELEKPAPRRHVLEREIESLRSVRELEAVIVNWWDSPVTQGIVDELTRIGL